MIEGGVAQRQCKRKRVHGIALALAARAVGCDPRQGGVHARENESAAAEMA